MKRTILLATWFASCFLSIYHVDAQSYTQLVTACPEKAANIYYPYHPLDSVQTPAPKGYRPFYISHYGRHGSRYHTSEKYIDVTVKALRKAAEAGLLTEDGKEAWRQAELLLAAHQGMAGELSPRGAREHREIAERLYRRFPEVFGSRKRREVHCVSSPLSRCLMSMANFTHALKGRRPELQFDFKTGERYFDYICHKISYENWYADANRIEDSVRAKVCHYDRLFERLFTDKERAIACLGNPQKVAKDFFQSGSICGDLDFLGVDLFRFFDREELAEQGSVRNIRTYATLGNSKELGEYSSRAALKLVKDIVDKADTALIAGSRTAADLRFGHDTGILPLLNCIGVEGMGKRRPSVEAEHCWNAFEMTPMGTNFQMIFYRSRRGEVLVKMLHNERETSLEALPPYRYPYYKWKDLRAYLTSLYAPDGK